MRKMNPKWLTWAGIALIVVGLLLWLYADYGMYTAPPNTSSCTTSGITAYATAASGGSYSSCLVNLSGWFDWIYLAIALLVLGTALWTYQEHSGKLVFLSIGLIAAGIVIWALGDYSWVNGYDSSNMLWFATVGVGAGLVVAGTVLWAYLDRKILF